MLNRLRSGRIHPDVAAAGGGPRSLSKTSSAKSFRRQVSGKSDAQREIDRSLAMSDEDHAAWLQDRVKHDGRKAAMALLKFYLRMLKPCVVVAAYVAAMYAAISWSIPNLLCNSIAKENSVGGWVGGKEQSFPVRLTAGLTWRMNSAPALLAPRRAPSHASHRPRLLPACPRRAPWCLASASTSTQATRATRWPGGRRSSSWCSGPCRPHGWPASAPT